MRALEAATTEAAWQHCEIHRGDCLLRRDCCAAEVNYIDTGLCCLIYIGVLILLVKSPIDQRVPHLEIWRQLEPVFR